MRARINGLGGYPVAVVPPAGVAGLAGPVRWSTLRLTDLDWSGLVCSACPGMTAARWPGFQPSLLRRLARRAVFAGSTGTELGADGEPAAWLAAGAVGAGVGGQFAD